MPGVLEPSWVGRRVSVRRVLERAQDGTLRQGDVVGELAGLDAQTAVIEARSGLVEVPLALVTAARIAPPSTADELALEAVVADGIRPAETEQLGGWRLRADSGFLRRANSVLPLRAVGLPLEPALDTVRDWYERRDLPVKFQVPTEARRLLDAELGERGWPAEDRTHVMAARLDAVSAPTTDAPPVHLAAAPDDAWLALYRGGGGLTGPGRALLSRHPRVTFASARVDGRTVAVARGTVDPGPGGAWLALNAVEVAPDFRRQGLATAVTAALWEWGRDQGAVRTVLTVLADNEPAVGLYERLGYWAHHDYHYRTRPAGAP
jgi:GNAT superfamily N-acetyltransferase